MPPFLPRLSPSSRRLAPVAAATVAGLALSLTLFTTIRAWEHHAAQAAVATAATQRLELLRESLGSSLETLHALGSLYAGGETIDREHFHRFAAAALARRPELQALSWTPRVPAAQRARFETAAQAEGFSTFEFTERDPASGRTIRARDQPDAYYPVDFIEPLARNLAAFGYDLNARRDTLTLARDTAQAVATPPIQLMQEPAREPGFIVYLPLYDGPPPASVDARRAAHTGFVAAVFRIADLVRPALARQPGLRVSLHDASRASAPLIYVAPAFNTAPPDPGLAPAASRCRSPAASGNSSLHPPRALPPAAAPGRRGPRSPPASRSPPSSPAISSPVSAAMPTSPAPTPPSTPRSPSANAPRPPPPPPAAPSPTSSPHPHLANWGLTIINGAFAAAGIFAVSDELIAGMKNQGVLYHGLQILGGGSILGGLILAAIAVGIIDRTFRKAAGFALAGAALTFFGFMHGERIGLGQTLPVATGYVLFAGVLLACARFATASATAPAPESTPEDLGEPEPATA